MLATAIFWAFAIRQEPRIDFEVRAATLADVLGKVSRVTGLALKADRAMQNEIVCVRALQVPPGELISKLAEATSCEWREQNGVKTLYRSPAVTRRLREAQIASRAAKIEKLFAKQAEALKKLGSANDRALAVVKAIDALGKKMSSQPRSLNLDGPRLASPASSLVLQLAIDLGPMVFAELVDGDNLTFSNSPTAAQLPLGSRSQAYIDQYTEAESRLAAILPKTPPAGVGKELLDDIYSAADSAGGVGKVLLRAVRNGKILSLYVKVYSDRGKLREWGFANSLTLGDDMIAEEEQAGTKTAPEMVELSPLSAEFAADSKLERMTSRSFGVAPAKPLGAGTVRVLENPETIDPLALSVADGCMAMAARAASPMIAYLGDGAERAGLLSTAKGRLNLTRFRALLGVEGQETFTRDGWLVIQPTEPLSSLADRLPRSALGTLVRSALAAKAITVEGFARFHFQAGRPAVTSTIGGLYQQDLIRSGIAWSPQYSHSHEALAALGSLDSDQWQALNRGETLPTSQMTEVQRGVFEAWMRNGEYYLEVDPKAGMPDIMSDSTEYAPDGLPGQARVAAGANPMNGIRIFASIRDFDGSVSEGSIDSAIGKTPAEVARAYAKGGYYKSLDEAVADMRKAKIEVTSRTDVVLRLRMLPTHEIVETFNGAPSERQFLSYDQWPGAMREEFESTFRKEFKPAGGQ